MSSKISQPSRRRMLQSLFAGIIGSFSFQTRAEDIKHTPPRGLKKRSRESVGYRDFPYEKRSCAKCMLYVGDGECVIIEGKVSPDGWCNQWTPPTIG